VSFIPCGICGEKPFGKIATVVSWWYGADNRREAWRQKCCARCLMDTVASFQAGQSTTSSALTVCPMCDSDSSSNLDGIFLNIYAPKRPVRECALPTCGSCATTLRKRLTTGAEMLADRRDNARAEALAITPEDEWSALPW